MDDFNMTSFKYTTFFPPGVLDILTLADFVIIYTCISLFGIVSNIINIIIFIKMGASEPVNISLLGLSISDLFFLLLTLLLSICYYPFWKNADLNFNILDMKMLTLGWPQFYFKRVGNWITAFITLERCVCIAVPLRVKEMITPMRTVTIIITIYVLMALTISPAYFSASYQSRYDTTRNRTVIVFVYHDNSPEMDAIATVLSFTFTVITFISVIICTVVLVVSLKMKSTWRGHALGAEKASVVSTRDQKVIKMVIMLAIIFIISFTPDVVVMLTMSFDHRVSIYGNYFDLFLVLNGISEPLLAISASINIFVYFNMSSKFRVIYLKYCCTFRFGQDVGH